MAKMPRPSGKFWKPVGGYVTLVHAGGRWYRLPEGQLGAPSASAADSYFAECDRLNVPARRRHEPDKYLKAIREHGNNVGALDVFPRWEW
jgi:hypothetical protein